MRWAKKWRFRSRQDRSKSLSSGVYLGRHSMVNTRNAKIGLLRHYTETAFYVANTPVTATRAAKAVRTHWTIENTSQHSRDVVLGGVAQGSSRDSGWNSTGGEDRSRICTNPGVFARLRSFAFNILKADQTDTLNQDRYRAGLAGIRNLLRMLAVS